GAAGGRGVGRMAPDEAANQSAPTSIWTVPTALVRVGDYGRPGGGDSGGSRKSSSGSVGDNCRPAASCVTIGGVETDGAAATGGDTLTTSEEAGGGNIGALGLAGIPADEPLVGIGALAGVGALAGGRAGIVR